MVIPSAVLVEDNGSSKTPGRVDASSGDGDGGQVNQENCKPNGKRSQNLHTQIHIHSKLKHSPNNDLSDSLSFQA